MIKYVLCTIIFFQLSFELGAQKIHSGQFSIPLIKPGWDLGKPTSKYYELKGQVLHFVFSHHKYALVIKDSRGDIWQRQVYDFDKNIHYVVYKIDNAWLHQTDTISSQSSFYKIQNATYDFFYTGLMIVPEKTRFKGFNCYSINLVSREYGTVKLLATDQIILPSTGIDIYHKPTFLDSVVILKATFENENGVKVAAMDSFYTTIQNPEWLIPAQEGAITMQEYQNLKLQKIKPDSYSQEGKRGDNLDIGVALYDNGLISKHVIGSQLENNHNVDKLFWLKETEYLSRSFTYDSLIGIWDKVGLLSQNIARQIDRYMMRNWKDSREKFFTMMTLLMLNEMVSDRNNRKTIIANLIAEGYQFKAGADTVISEYLSGNLDASDLFLSVQGMHPVPLFYKTRDKQKIESEVRNLLVMVFPELNEELKVWITHDSSHMFIHVSTNKFEYRSDIYREYHMDEEGNEKPQKKLKEFSFDVAFLSDFEKVLKQMGADYQKGRIFGFRSFADNLEGMQLEDYILITNAHPELSLFKTPWYIGALDILKADWFADITIAYRNSEMAYYQSSFNSLYLCSTFIEYLPSDRKATVIEFLRNHQQDLNLNEEVIKGIAERLQFELIELNDDISRCIPGIQITVSRTYEPFLSQLPIDTSFSELFPGLYTFIRQDFNPTIMGLSDDASEMYWRDGLGHIDTIPMNFHSTKESVLAFLHKKLRPIGYGIYTIPSLLITEKTYYYLSDQQKDELEEIMDIQLFAIK